MGLALIENPREHPVYPMHKTSPSPQKYNLTWVPPQNKHFKKLQQVTSTGNNYAPQPNADLKLRTYRVQGRPGIFDIKGVPNSNTGTHYAPQPNADLKLRTYRVQGRPGIFDFNRIDQAGGSKRRKPTPPKKKLSSAVASPKPKKKIVRAVRK
jgi:hypothetical protein